MESTEIRSLGDLRAIAKARRRELGLTQSELASRAGVSRQFVSYFERGEGEGGELTTTLRLMAALEVTLLAVPSGSAPTHHEVHIADELHVHDEVARQINLDDHLSSFDRWLEQARKPDRG